MAQKKRYTPCFFLYFFPSEKSDLAFLLSIFFYAWITIVSNRTYVCNYDGVIFKSVRVFNVEVFQYIKNLKIAENEDNGKFYYINFSFMHN